MSFENHNPEETRKTVELALFNERIGQFTEDDLALDHDGSCKALEDKIRGIFPEIDDPERLRAMKAAISMHFMEKYF